LLIPAAFLGAVLMDQGYPVLGMSIAIVAFIVACFNLEKRDRKSQHSRFL
jgi:hypothetical protein